MLNFLNKIIFSYCKTFNIEKFEYRTVSEWMENEFDLLFFFINLLIMMNENWLFHGRQRTPTSSSILW